MVALVGRGDGAGGDCKRAGSSGRDRDSWRHGGRCELLESVTTAPPAGAGPSSVTVAVTLVPPVTLVGLSENVEIAAAR